MPIIISEPVVNKGKKDAKRHREKQREAIKEKLPEIISNESLITRKKGKKVRIPIKSIDIPHFRPKRDQVDTGLGQGKGKPGDIIGKRPGSGSGGPGTDPGDDILETEVELEELIELMLEDLGLPRLEQKEVQDIVVEFGFKFKGVSRSGPWPNLERKRTAKEGLKRFWTYLSYLEAKTGKEKIVCFRALKQAHGILSDALDLLENGGITFEENIIQAFPIISHDDLRFRKIDEDVQTQSKAVVIAMMDVSGSMSDMKKYLARSLLFWLVEFLRKLYEQVEVRFITHHALAKIVDEGEFFKTRESGGTYCYTAYELAKGLIEDEYPTKIWNVYVWHFSDGDDSDPEKTAFTLESILDLGINMFGYGEIEPGDDSDSSSLWNIFKKFFDLKEERIDGGIDTLFSKEVPFLGIEIKEREHILVALKEFLKKDRWVEA